MHLCYFSDVQNQCMSTYIACRKLRLAYAYGSVQNFEAAYSFSDMVACCSPG